MPRVVACLAHRGTKKLPHRGTKKLPQGIHEWNRGNDSNPPGPTSGTIVGTPPT